MRRPASTSSNATGRIVSSATSDAAKVLDLDKAADRLLVRGRREAPGIELDRALAPGAGQELAVEDRVLQADRSPEDSDRRTARALDTDRATEAGRTPAGPDRARDMERDQVPDTARVLDRDRDQVSTDGARDTVLVPRASAASREGRRF